MRLNHAVVFGITVVFAASLFACDSPAEDDWLTCSNNECKVDNRTIRCSEDGDYIYEYVDTSISTSYPDLAIGDPDIPFGKSYSWFGVHYQDIDKTNEGALIKYEYACDTTDNYQCKIIGNSIGCYHQCNIQSAKESSWCEAYGDTKHHLFRHLDVDHSSKCELNPVDSNYYTRDRIPETSFCSSDRTCDNKTGCTSYIEEDGQPCKGSDRSECVERDGQSYALVCKAVISSSERYYIATPCEICSPGNKELGSAYSDPFCLEKCSSEGEIKYTCNDSDLDDDNYGYSAQWKCSRQSNGQTYWSLEKTELCPRDCAADGQCNMYPGEREACTAADYQNKCIADGKLMYCEDRLNPPKTVVTDCQVLGSLFNIEMTCLDIKNGSKNDAKCGPVKNTTPCTTVGTKKDVCQTYSPNDSVSVAYRYRAVCTEFSDGSLRYLIDADTLSGCSSGKCNDFQSDCEY